MERVRPGTAVTRRPAFGLVGGIRRALWLFAALLLLAPARATARQGDGRRAKATVEAGVGATAIRGQASLFGGGSGLLDLGLPVRFGGAGWVLLSTERVPGGTPGDHYDLHVAYGGVLLDAPLVARGKGALTVRALFGVGNAKVNLPVVTTLIGADNFGIAEPEIRGNVRLVGHLKLTVGAGYRFVFGVDDVPGVAPADLRGPSLRIGLSVGDS